MTAVSIIVPVYNVEKDLPRCVRSLLRQSLRDIEIILVDDGSSDTSGKLCDGYALTDQRLKVIHIDNGGPARARNIGMDAAHGEYLGFVDSDDYVDSNMFETLYHLANGKDIAMCGFSTDTDGTIQKIEMSYPALVESGETVRSTLLQRYYTGNVQGLYSTCTKIFRKKMIIDHHIRMNEKLRRAEDAWFVYDVLRVAESFAFTEQALYFYRQNSDSIMHMVQKDQYKRWKENKQKLLEDNAEYRFQINYNRFYQDFLYKLAVYCRDLCKTGDKEAVAAILHDPFYRQAARFDKYVPAHIKALHRLGRVSPTLAIGAYQLWR